MYRYQCGVLASGLPWGQLNNVLGEWWQQLHSRNELETLDDSMLRDIGLSRPKLGFYLSKHIWTN